MESARIHITGIVQGVGFRPFVYNLAQRFGLKGYCLNDSEGVVIEVQGESVEGFIRELKDSPPPLSRIESLTVEKAHGGGYKDFTIRESVSVEGKFALVSPDMAVCPDCLRELFNPYDRRYLYPFINCTNCGPRYSIIQDIPYDRPKTTMARFTMCGACESEYLDPANRRFHAQPNACPECGPQVWLYEQNLKEPHERNYDAVRLAQRLLKGGAILALRGLGGFHLACDAEQEDAVQRLRDRKRKSLKYNNGKSSNKPFAIMAPDIGTIRALAVVSDEEQIELTSGRRPIVLLQKKEPCLLAKGIAPNNRRLGVMLPYTPLHYLLFNSPADRFKALVMTSGNLSEEPIVTSNSEAITRLSGIADFFLLHDRDIYMRVDDSIVRVEGGRTRTLRRARGFTPAPIAMDEEMDGIFAAGALLKNTFCLTKGKLAILSQHIGDLENEESLEFYKETLKNLKNTFRASPRIVAHDMHPDYISTKFALEYASEHGIPPERVVAVQHHHAHIVSAMAEHGLKGKVIGIAFDGTGYGADGRIWGGEILIADRGDFVRKAHLAYIALPGGDSAVKEPWRMALSYLSHTFGDEIPLKGFIERVGEKKARIVLQMIKGGVNSPLTSSMGRLFDAVASLIGLRDEITFEAEAAIELENIADPGKKDPYPFDINGGEIDSRPLIRAIVEGLNNGIERPVIAGRFHHTVAEMALKTALTLSKESGIKDVVVCGGVFQNSLLSGIIRERFESSGFRVWTQEKVPANDGGISLGQAVAAWERVKGEK